MGWGGLWDTAKGLVPGYNADENAKDAHAGIQQARADTLTWGKNSANRFQQSKGTAQGRYSRANDAYNNWTAPANTTNWYNQAQSKYNQRPTFSQQDYQTGSSGDQSQNYYNSFQGTGVAAGNAQKRAQYGYGDNAVQDRYGNLSMQYMTQPGQGQSNLGHLGTYRDAVSSTQDRIGQRQNLGGDALDSRYGARNDFNNRSTATAGVLGSIDSHGYSSRSDQALQAAQGMTPDQYTGDIYDQLKSGNSNAGQAAKDLKSKDAYSRVNNEGPSFEENFYLSQLTGDNPAYNMLRSDAMKDTQRASAARGSFVSGKSMEDEQKMSARLAADEFARRGDLASTAGQAHRAQLGQVLQGADQVDKYTTDLAKFQDTGLQSLAQSRDAAAMAKQKYIGEMSNFGDTQHLGADTLRGNLAGREDQAQTERQAAADAMAKNLSDRDATRNAALDSLYQNQDTVQAGKEKLYGDQAFQADEAQRLRQQQLNDLAGKTEDTSMTRQQQQDKLNQAAADEAAQNQKDKQVAANSASDEYQKYLNYKQQGAQNADTSDLSRDKYMADTAKMSDDEKQSYYKDQFNAAMQSGDAMANMDKFYDMASNGALDESELSAIDLQLKDSGVDAQKRQAVMDDLYKKVDTGLNIAKAAKGGK